MKRFALSFLLALAMTKICAAETEVKIRDGAIYCTNKHLLRDAVALDKIDPKGIADFLRRFSDDADDLCARFTAAAPGDELYEEDSGDALLFKRQGQL
jgi:hypothetical protein